MRDLNAQDWRKVEGAIIDVAEDYIEVWPPEQAGISPTETSEIARKLDQELRAEGFEIRQIRQARPCGDPLGVCVYAGPHKGKPHAF